MQRPHPESQRLNILWSVSSLFLSVWRLENCSVTIKNYVYRLIVGHWIVRSFNITSSNHMAMVFSAYLSTLLHQLALVTDCAPIMPAVVGESVYKTLPYLPDMEGLHNPPAQHGDEVLEARQGIPQCSWKYERIKWRFAVRESYCQLYYTLEKKLKPFAMG